MNLFEKLVKTLGVPCVILIILIVWWLGPWGLIPLSIVALVVVALWWMMR